MNPPSAFGTFRVLHQIGSGVLGPVFRAYDSRCERLVAVKVFKLDLVPEQATRVAEGLRALVTGAAPDSSIVTAVDAGLSGTLPYLALEYVAGEALDVSLRKAGPPPVPGALDLCRAIAGAIDASWSRGHGHGALHPRDVFVTAAGGVFVTGFGVAQALEAAGVRTPVRRPYAAPERVAGAAWDRRADVYALAGIAQDVLDARKARGQVDDVRAVLDRALNENPDARFDSATEFVAALEAAVHARAEATPMPEAVALVAEPRREVALPAPPPAAVELDEPELIKTGIDVDVSAAAASPLFALPKERALFPWGATLAVGLAGLSVGAVLGYQAGFWRGTSQTRAATIEQAVKAPVESVPDPPVTIAPDEPVPSVGQRLRTAEPAPATASTGALDVDSLPRGARVRVDGKLHGSTPVRVPGLAPGYHRVLIELAGHKRVASTVRVAAGEPTPFKVRLEEATGPALGRKR